MNVTPTPEQEHAALAWLSLLHDQPSSGDQATFSHWLRANPAHVEAYAQAQGLQMAGKHHEIYLGNPLLADPEKLKTILRHAVTKQS